MAAVIEGQQKGEPSTLTPGRLLKVAKAGATTTGTLLTNG